MATYQEFLGKDRYSIQSGARFIFFFGCGGTKMCMTWMEIAIQYQYLRARFWHTEIMILSCSTTGKELNTAYKYKEVQVFISVTVVVPIVYAITCTIF